MAVEIVCIVYNTMELCVPWKYKAIKIIITNPCTGILPLDISQVILIVYGLTISTVTLATRTTS